jgi:hypothetical protein
MVVMAATIAAPSAKALATSREMGRREMCILMFVFLGWKMLGMRSFFCFCERWVGWDEPQGGKGTQEDILLLQAVKIIHQLGERTLSVGYPAKHRLVMLMI